LKICDFPGCEEEIIVEGLAYCGHHQMALKKLIFWINQELSSVPIEISVNNNNNNNYFSPEELKMIFLVSKKAKNSKNIPIPRLKEFLTPEELISILNLNWKKRNMFKILREGRIKYHYLKRKKVIPIKEVLRILIIFKETLTVAQAAKLLAPNGQKKQTHRLLRKKVYEEKSLFSIKDPLKSRERRIPKSELEKLTRSLTEMNKKENELSTKEVAKMLKIHRKTVIKYFHQGKLRGRKTPKGLYFPKDQFLR